MNYFSQNVWYGLEPVQLYFNGPSEIQCTVQQSVGKKLIYKGSYFIDKEQLEEKKTNAVIGKIFYVMIPVK